MWNFRGLPIKLTAVLLVIGSLFLMGSGGIQSAYNLIQNAGSPLTKRQTVNFTGSGISCADSGGITVCTVAGSAGGGGGITGYSNVAVAGLPTATVFLPVMGSSAISATEAPYKAASPAAATVSNLFVTVGASLGAGNAIVVTLRVNGASSALTCNIGAVATSCSDTTHTVSLSQADLIDWELDGTSVTTIPNFALNIYSQFGTTTNPAVRKYSQSFSSVTSVALTDNLATTVKTTQCYDNASPPNLIVPQNVAITNSNTVTVTFGASQSGTCIVQG